MIRKAVPSDAAAIAGIYNYYIKNTVITFEEQPVSIKEMEERIVTVTQKYPWLVLEENGEMRAYAYINKYRDRSAYRYTAELAIYLKNGLEGKGLGSSLMSQMFKEAVKCGMHALVSGITLPNERSLAIHRKFGFEKIAEFKEVGFKFGRWLNVGYWEVLLKNER